LARVAEQECGVIGDRESCALPLGVGVAGTGGQEVVKLSAQLGHGRAVGQQIFRRGSAQRHHNFGPDDRDLAHEIRRAGFALLALGRAVVRRTAFHDVSDVDIFPAQTHSFDHVGEQLAGATDERLALRVFIGAGAFTHEH